MLCEDAVEYGELDVFFRRNEDYTPSEYDRPVNVADDSMRVPELDEVLDKRAKEADKEEENKSIVDLSLGKLTCRTNHSPDDRCSPKNLCGRADEIVFLVRRTHVWDIGEHPCLDAKLHSSRDDSCYYLTPKHGTWTGFALVILPSHEFTTHGIFM